MADIEWDDDVVDQLLAPGGEVHREAMKAAIRVERAAKRLCPVDTGRLRASITHSDVDRDGDAVKVRVGTNVEYAAYVELGTSRAAAQPYLRPALSAASTTGQP